MPLEIPSIDNCCDKEIYAFYGLAAYVAQVMEFSALNLLVALHLPEVNLCTKELFDEINASLEKRTFGHLLHKCKSEINLSDQDLDSLNKSLDTRNYLVHQFFKSHTENLFSNSGQQEMKSELQEIISMFHQADMILENIYMPFLKKYGVTAEYVKRELAEMHNSAEQRDKFA